MNRGTYAVRMWGDQPPDAGAYLEFLKAAYPDDPLQWDQERWRWQYLENPNHPGRYPPIWIFTDGERVLAQLGTIPVRLGIDGKSHAAAWTADLVVLPEFRNRGVGPLLLKAVKTRFDFLMGLGLNEMSHALFARDRWRDLGMVPHYVKVLDARAVAGSLVKGKLGAVMLGTPANGVLWALSLMERRANSGISVTRCERFGEDFDALARRLSEKFRRIVWREAEYLNWKYIRQPRMGYAVYRADRAGALHGYVVLRRNRTDRLVYGVIADLLADPDNRPVMSALMSTAIGWFRAAGVSFIRSYATDVRYQRVLRRYGFFKRRSYVRFMVAAKTGEAERIGTDSLSDWFIMKGDADLDRVPFHVEASVRGTSGVL